MGYIGNIEQLATNNKNFREVIYTAKHCQLVLMSLNPGEDIGEEIHQLDQFFRVEEGNGQVVLDGITTEVSAGFVFIVPEGTLHNVINTGTSALKLYTIYSPPNHRDSVVHLTKEIAELDDEHFDGNTTE